MKVALGNGKRRYQRLFHKQSETVIEQL